MSGNFRKRMSDERAVTDAINPKSAIWTQWGKLTNEQWLMLESARMRAKGAHVEVIETEAGDMYIRRADTKGATP